MIRTVGALVGAAARADQLATGYEQRLAGIASASRSSPRPEVYFEEWDIAGGEDPLPDLRFQKAAKDRIIFPDDVPVAAPDVIPASCCRKKVVPDRIRKLPGRSEIPAVRNDRIIEIKSPLILQPGSLTDGLAPSSRRCGRSQSRHPEVSPASLEG